jgi:hypothetical protein
MEMFLLENPRLPLIILIILTAGDLFLARFLRKSGLFMRDEYFEYEEDEYPGPSVGGVAYFAFILLRISPVFLVLLLWVVAVTSKSPFSVWSYQAILGFSLFLFLIINLRHLETILTDILTRLRRDDISGKLKFGKGYSLGYSGIRLFTLFVILAVIAVLRFEAFYIGAAAAPLSLIIRNLVLINR